MGLIDIKSMTKNELREDIQQCGESKFRADQIYDWLHKKHVQSFDEMSNLSNKSKDAFKDRYFITKLNTVRVQESKLDGTKKFLFELSDGNYVESVFMKYKHGNSVCISSQVGCKMGCKFCASTLDGFTRNLLASEMLEQIYDIIRNTKERVSNVVIMGTGEPLDNFEQLVKFLELLSNEDGINISQRNITVSTCGLVPQIYKLAEYDFQITLALSLHATTDEKRKRIMPIANKYALEDVLKAMDFYFQKTNRRVSFEYSLIAGVNDSMHDATELIAIAKDRNCHINLIPVNPIKERDFVRPDMSYVQSFKNKLEKYRINVTIRREMGADIDGACGQLRKRHLEKGKENISC